MPTRNRAPAGAPCWADLWTSDVEGARRFYSELLGWEAAEPNSEFGGYFMFLRDGVPIAGGMGAIDAAPAADLWQIYLSSDDIATTLKRAEADGAGIVSDAMEVGDVGIQGVLTDPTGALLGVWQPKEFPGFTVLGEPGAPSWFELHTRDFPRAVEFYQSTFGWDLVSVGDTDEFRYSVMRDPSGEGELAGMMDASAFLPDGVPSHWSVYWQVADVDVTVAKAIALGGSVVMGAEDTPYGRLATLADPFGAQFKLRTPPSA